MNLYLRGVVGAGEVLAWLGGPVDEEEEGVWALCLEVWGRRAGSQQEALEAKRKEGRNDLWRTPTFIRSRK